MLARCVPLERSGLFKAILSFYSRTVFTGVSAAALFKFYTPQVRRLFDGRRLFESGLYLKVGHDKGLRSIRYYHLPY